MPREFAESFVHTVVAGDTLSSIAAANRCSVAEVLAANMGLVDDPDFIQAGWELVIPGQLSGNRRETPPMGGGMTVYTVRPGDTLGELAERWGSSIDAVAELNGIVDISLIFAGQRLRRPAAALAPGSPSNEPASMRVNRLQWVRWPVDLPPAVVAGGYREDYGGYLHRGVDIGGMAVGTPVFAPASGTVTVHRPGDGWGDGSFGTCVVIDHPGTPWWSIYAHLSDAERVSGEAVAGGEIIGRVGFSGRVEPPGPAGAHLHWQVSAHSGFPPGFEYTGNPMDFFA